MRFEQALKRLAGSDYVLLGGGFVVLRRHRRWHLLTLTYFGSMLGLQTVHFMSEDRGHDTVREWLSLGRMLPLEDVSEILPFEIEAKVLEQAEDYLPWIQDGQMDIGGGPTTDSQSFADLDAEHPSRALDVIAKMMDRPMQGAYLRFKDTYRALSEHDA
jgi:hypothetical protein